jgi:choline dehydrogenase-like flavoprotein
LTGFDYVVVGGGSAGCVLASRLTEDAGISVCLLEAGPSDWHPAIHVPVGLLWMMRSPGMNWNLDTQPEPQLAGRQLFWPRGKTLGGSSSSNAMCYIRGHARDYDDWAESGCPGWSFKDVLPYFKRSENQERGADEFHGTGGPLNVADLRSPNELCDAFVKAGVQAGFAHNRDFNGATQEGVGLFQVTQKNGERCSAAKGYLTPVRSRPNLTVLTGVHATRILTELTRQGTPRATGMQYVQNGKQGSVQARREVILAAGAIFSPQLLMLSGIGDKAELAAKGIDCVKHLPGVGKNLQDHLDVMVVQQSRKWVSYNFGPGNVLKGPWLLGRYLARRDGMFSTNGAEACGFIKSDASQPIPDLQFHFTPAKLKDHGRNISFLMGQGYSLHVCNLRPKSRGSVSLQGPDPLQPPAIHANYLSDPDDLAKMVKGVKHARKILAQAAMDPYRGDECLPGQAVQSDADIAQFIREYAETIYHPVGTCKMGVDDMAVVDPALRVMGVAHLRVVDASIMPTLVGGNTNAPTIMIAEKAVDMIKAARHEPASEFETA